jgi:dCMP deaminase
MYDEAWLEWLFGHASHAATKSKDPTKVGAALVNPRKSVILTAYNGPPRGVRDTPDRLVRPRKYLFAAHAEANLISEAARNGICTDDCTVVCTHHPCASCARTLIQAGIVNIIVGPGTTSMPAVEFAAAAEMFFEAGVRIIKHQPEKTPPPPPLQLAKLAAP